MQVKVHDTIKKSVDEVWDAIVNPEKINKFFVSRASAPIVVNQYISWEFADYSIILEISVFKVEVHKNISFSWEACVKRTTVEMHFISDGLDQTKIEITESEFDLSDSEMQKAMQQTQGWTDFICSMKAWLYAGVNLRNGINY